VRTYPLKKIDFISALPPPFVFWNPAGMAASCDQTVYCLAPSLNIRITSKASYLQG